MRLDTRLDYAVFQLNPTRTRCELHIFAQGLTYKLAAGLLQPFLAHLSAAEEQLAAGGYSIRLEPSDPSSAVWFTKGTMERFVRFVSTPDILERASNIDMELIEIEKNLHMQSQDELEDTANEEELLSKLSASSRVTGVADQLEQSAKESFESADVGKEETEQRLYVALETRRMMLVQELEVAITRAMAAGFNVDHIGDLIAFAETFGAKRLWKACSNVLSLFKKRQQARAWQDSPRVSDSEVAQAETPHHGSMAHHVGSREISDLQGRGVKLDDFRRTSLPSEGRPFMEDIGFEKLTRRGSLDELSGEFLQVAARMRSSGMMEGANIDLTNNWQAPISGGSGPVNDETHPGVAHMGGNGNFRDAESALKAARGYQNITAWKGQPQHHSIHNVHPLMHGHMHASVPASFGFSGIAPPGLPYPLYPGNPYMGHAYAEVNGWQIPSHVPPPYWSHPMLNAITVPGESGQRDGALPASNNEEANKISSKNLDAHLELAPSTPKSIGKLLNVSKLHGETPASTQRAAHDLLKVTESHEELPVTPQRPEEFNGEPPASTESPAGYASTLSELNEPPAYLGSQTAGVANANAVNREPPALTERAANGSVTVNQLHERASVSPETPIGDLSVSEDIQQVNGTHGKQLVKNMQETDKVGNLSHEEDGEPSQERARRLPIRSSSPSRRSASPLRKVQIGRSGSRKPGLVAFRSVSYVDQDSEEQIKRENNDRDSSESWSEDSDDGKTDKELKEQPVRARVQDVIGLFESKKDGSDKIGELSRKESGRLQPKNCVLKRWTESGSIKKDLNETEDSTIISRIRKGTSLAFVDAVTERGSDQLSTSNMEKEGTSPLQEETLNLALAIKEGDSPHEQTAEDFTFTSESPLYLELDIPGNQKLDDGAYDLDQRELSFEPADIPVAEISMEFASSCMPVNCDTEAVGTAMVVNINTSQERTDETNTLDDRENGNRESGINFEIADSKKVSDRDVKAKAMQEMLEKRKATSGNRLGKPNPLAEAQLRAEKLRAYKAGLLKSKQEKDEEEKKRIEDLKSQRKERIAARSSPSPVVGGSSTQSPATRQIPQNPLTVSKLPSPTALSHKLLGSSPRGSVNVAATSLSPNLPKSKAAIKLPRTPTGTLKANENALSRSVPSLSDLKKESLKAALAVRTSTGSPRLSQMKNLKDAYPNSSPKANGHSEEKRRSLPLVMAQKGISPTKDTKAESSPVVRKPTKGSMVATKDQKKTGNSRGSGKVKKPAVEAEAIDLVASLGQAEQVNKPNEMHVEKALNLEKESVIDHEEHKVDVSEISGDVKGSSMLEISTSDGNDGYAQIRAPASTEMGTTPAAENSPDPIEDANMLGLTISCEALLSEDLKEKEAFLTENSMEKEVSTVISGSHADSMVCVEGENAGTDNETNAEDKYCAPIAHVSLGDDNVAACGGLDASGDKGSIPTDQIPTSPTEEYSLRHAVPSESPLDAPKSLPRLHEAIQQAHSPEFVPAIDRAIDRTGKTRVREPESLKMSKDHAKGFKRLLLLGRKNNRSSHQYATDSISLSVETNNDGGHNLSSNGAELASSSAPFNLVDKPKVESSSGTASNKGSRSFFSLSTFRTKGEGKV